MDGSAGWNWIWQTSAWVAQPPAVPDRLVGGWSRVASAGMTWLFAAWPPHCSSRLAHACTHGRRGALTAEVETHKHVFTPLMVTVCSHPIGQSKVDKKDMGTADTGRYQSTKVMDFNLPYQVQLHIVSKALSQMFH